MPIEKSTDEWQQAGSSSATKYIHKVLDENYDRAFTAEEVAHWTYENLCDYLPVTLCRAYEEGNKDPLVSHIASLLARLQQQGRVHSRIVEVGDREKRCYTTGFTRTRPSDVVKSLEGLEAEVGRLESRLQEESASNPSTGEFNQNINELDLKIEEIGESLDSLWHNYGIIDKRTISLEDVYGEALFELRQRIEDIEQQLQDGDEGEDDLNWLVPEDLESVE